MAGDWIKMRGNLWDDPRIARLCDETESSEAAIVGGLYWLWATADQHSEDGIMQGLTIRSIDRKTGINSFGAALIAIGWLADHPEGVRIVRFDDHNGTSAKRRCSESKRKMSARDADNVQTSCGIDEEKTQHVCAPREREREREDTNTLTNPNGLVVASDAAESASQDEIAKTGTNCPHQEIIALYHEVLPQCPKVRDWTPARATQLRARWNEDSTRQNMTYWRRFFEYVKTCDFLVGVQPDSRKTPFFADLEWMVKQANFTKIRERKYENRATK